MFILADHGTTDRYAIPAKGADKSRIRLLVAIRQQESPTVYTHGFQTYEPLEEDNAITCEDVVHGDGEYVDRGLSREHLREPWIAGSIMASPYLGISKDKLTPYHRAFYLRREFFRNREKKL